MAKRRKRQRRKVMMKPNSLTIIGMLRMERPIASNTRRTIALFMEILSIIIKIIHGLFLL